MLGEDMWCCWVRVVDGYAFTFARVREVRGLSVEPACARLL